jgi:hypothetical protein
VSKIVDSALHRDIHSVHVPNLYLLDIYSAKDKTKQKSSEHHEKAEEDGHVNCAGIFNSISFFPFHFISFRFSVSKLPYSGRSEPKGLVGWVL